MIISKNLLGQKLKEMYENAPHNEQVLMIHLFGIKFADIIKANGYNAREILEAANMNLHIRLRSIKELKCQNM